MDNDTAIISDPMVIIDRTRVLGGWRRHAMTPPAFPAAVQIIGRSRVGGRQLAEFQASCSQEAQLLVTNGSSKPGGTIASMITQITKHDTVMGGYAADDTFGSPRGSRPDRPPV